MPVVSIEFDCGLKATPALQRPSCALLPRGGQLARAFGHRTLAPQLVEALKAKGADDVIVVVGGVIPRQDYEFLLENGVAAVFGPGTNVLDAARGVLDLMEGKRRNV